MRVLEYNSAAALRDFLQKRGLGMRKQFGQNFLINPHSRQRLLDALEIRAGDQVWEIGPGLGAMTAGLLEQGAIVRAFEIDRGFIAVLEELFGGIDRFSLVAGDVLKTWKTAGETGTYLLGNLPYTIAAVLVADLIEGRRFFTRMVIMVQREVGRRILAAPGSKDYSAFSVLCASAYRVRPLMVLSPGSFYPVPRVDSQGLCFDLRTDRDPGGYSPLFYPLIRSLFSARRKTVWNNLQSFAASLGRCPRNKTGIRDLCREALTIAGLEGESRAEEWGVDAFSALARSLEDLLNTEASEGSAYAHC